MSTLLSRAVRHLPDMRRIIQERDVALAERDAALAERDNAIASRDTPTAGALRRVLSVASSDTYIHARLNGSPLWLPRDTLRTMVHCASWEADGALTLWVETQHLNWMMERLSAGGIFLDVGAATGATTLPIVTRLASSVAVIAYEPSTTARELLVRTLARNNIEGVTVRPLAVSDTIGSVQFREYAQDESGTTPWLPEASSLEAPLMASGPSRTYNVPVVTLDDDAMSHCTSPLVIKIDVEGFEVHVLRGAQQLIRTHRPYLSIDIHNDPFGDGMTTTEAAVVAILKDYHFERLGHVLLCSPQPNQAPDTNLGPEQSPPPS